MNQRNYEGYRLAVETTSLGAIVVSAAVTLLGFATIYFSQMYSSGNWSVVFNSIGSTIVSLGLLSIIFELIMRRYLQREMLRLVGIERAISSNNLLDAGKSSDLKWKEILQERSQFAVLMMDPEAWVADNWHHIEANGRSKALSLEFFLPDPDGEEVRRISKIISKDEFLVRKSIEQAIKDIEIRWNSARRLGNIKKGSKITIKLLDDCPKYFLCICDSVAVISLYSSVGHAPKEKNFYLVVNGREDTYPYSWFLQQIDMCRTCIVQYENEA